MIDAAKKLQIQFSVEVRCICGLLLDINKYDSLFSGLKFGVRVEPCKKCIAFARQGGHFSSCCKSWLKVAHSEEGTNYYICSKCLEPNDGLI